MAELPRGTVTFVFTDIEGSTALLKRLRDAYADVLAEHQRILRDTFGAHGGHEIDTQGDSFFFAFQRARDAVAAVVEAQRALAAHPWPEEGRVRVRMGLHTGEPTVGDQRYIGFGVNRAARISAAGHGGQVLVSNATRELVEDELPADVAIRELGSYRLKDVDRPERLYQLEIAGLGQDFPPLKAPRVAQPHPLRRRSLLAAALAGVLAAAVAIPLFAFGRGDAGGSIDAAAGNSLAILDPQQNRLVADVAAGTTPTDVALGAGAAWVTNTADGTVDRVDLATRTVRQTVSVGDGPDGIAFGAGFVWVANGLDGTVSRIDPRSNSVTQTITVGNGPGGIAVGEGAVWVVNRDDRTLTKIDAESGDVVADYPAGTGPLDVVVAAGSVWVADDGDGKVLRLDPRTGSAIETVGVGRSPAAIAATTGAVWVANTVDGTVSRIDPRTSTVTATISVGGQLTGMAGAGESVWVAAADGSLARIDAKTNAPAQKVDTGASPAGVAAGPEGVFVAVRPTAGAHRGGTLVMVNKGWFDYDPGSVDPAVSIAAVFAMTNDGLTGFRRVGGREGLQIVPDLAISLARPTDNGRTYTFRVRNGIRYSTGEPLRAADFRRALERVFDVSEFFPESLYEPIIGAKKCLSQPKRPCDLSRGIVTDDRSGTVTLHLAAPDPDLPAKLALWFASPLPKGVAARDAGTHPLPSTGPYRIAAYVPGKQMRLVRNPYFREWSRAATPAGYPDEIVVRLGVSPEEQVAAVSRGDADVADLSTEQVLERVDALRARYGGRLHSVPTSFGFYGFLNTRVPPFDDPRVRRALNLALDREAVVDGAGGPEVVSLSCQILPANFPGYRPYCPYRRDLGEARRLVAAVGNADLPVTVWTRVSYTKWTAPLVEALRSLGYRARMKTVEDREFWPTLHGMDPARIQAGVVGWIPEYPTAGNYLIGVLSGLEWVTGFSDGEVSRAVERARAVQQTDPNGADELWAAVDRLLTDRGPFVPLYNARDVTLVSERVGNFQFGVGLTLLDQLWVR